MIRVIRFVGRKQYSDHLKTAKHKLPKEIDRSLVLAAKLLERRAKSIALSAWNSSGQGTGDTRKGISGVLIASESRGIGKEGERHIAVIGPYKSRKANLMGIHERGMTIQRRSRSGNRHTASYPKRPVIAPAADQVQEQVFKLIGANVKAVIG